MVDTAWWVIEEQEERKEGFRMASIGGTKFYFYGQRLPTNRYLH
jgi:hypothetical protein